MVLDCTASLNVAVGAVETATLVAFDAGVCELIAGCKGSVVNDQVKAEPIGTPATFSAPLTVAVYFVL
jgi:hypothetical protein